MSDRVNVSVRGVEIAFGTVSVLKQIDLDIMASEFIVLLGPSGCGKSTLLNAIAGLIDVRAGQIWMGDRNVTWDEPKDRGISMVFQSYALYPRMKVRDNLSFGLRVARRPKAEIERRVRAASEALKITELLDRLPAELSGGQRQRVAIGRALVRETPVFLFDEPLSNLDAQLRAELRVEIKRLHHRLGATMIYVTHDQIEALTLADRIAVMKDGIIQQIGTPRDVYLRPANRFVASFVGSPSMNFISGRLQRRDGSISFSAGNVSIPVDGYAFTSPPSEGTAVTLGIRPEHVATGSRLTGATAVDIAVEMTEPMGADTLVWCSLAKSLFSVRFDGATELAEGDTLRIKLPPDRLSLFDDATGVRL